MEKNSSPSNHKDGEPLVTLSLFPRNNEPDLPIFSFLQSSPHQPNSQVQTLPTPTDFTQPSCIDHLSQIPNPNPNPNPTNVHRKTINGPSRSRARKSSNFAQGKSEIINPPYSWATDRRATVHSIEYLLSQDIRMIKGEVECKRCEKRYEIEFNLEAKFLEIASYIRTNRSTMYDRAPKEWMDPNLPNCKFCNNHNVVKPIISKKKSINWLFLLLGQMLGCCKLAQLKYFCKYTQNHKTGAKDRLLYLTYLALCKQLDPKGPFMV